jgi:hypothetical protein
MVQFLSMGVENSGGSRNTSATAMDMFLKSMRHVANNICSAVNTYLIPQLVAYNFPTDQFPLLKVRNVGEVKDMQMWASAMNNLITAEAISVDEATEAWIRDQMDMPRLQTPWKPPSERPGRVSVVEALNLSPKTSSVNNKNGGAPDGTVATPTGPAKSSSPNGGAGNVGKSPSSGAV